MNPQMQQAPTPSATVEHVPSDVLSKYDEIIALNREITLVRQQMQDLSNSGLDEGEEYKDLVVEGGELMDRRYSLQLKTRTGKFFGQPDLSLEKDPKSLRAALRARIKEKEEIIAGGEPVYAAIAKAELNGLCILYDQIVSDIAVTE